MKEKRTLRSVRKILIDFFRKNRRMPSYAEMIARPEASFLLQVSGDSMNGAGIVEGDLVIVERGREPKGGDIVIAEVDGEWTMKHFRREGKTVLLEAANPKYPPIRPREELKLGGVVTAVIRKYL